MFTQTVSHLQPGGSLGRSFCAALLTCGLLAGGVGSQSEAKAATGDPGKAVPLESAGEPGAEAVPAAPVPTADVTGKTLARITAPAVQVRCFASENSPVYEGTLPRGSVVEVGEESGAFRQVRLPLGVLGYVIKKYTTQPDAGFVRTSGTKVSFRYRPTPPRRAEQPVERLALGTMLRHLGANGEWWKVRFESDSAFVALKDIEILETPDAAAVAAYAALAARHEAEWRAVLDAAAAAQAAAAAKAELAAELASLRKLYAGELAKELKDQKLAPVLVAVGEFLAKAPEASPEHAAGKRLEASIQTQQVLVRAEQLVRTKPAKGRVPKVDIVRTPKDRLAHLQHIGWLSYHPRATGAAAFRLTKGGEVVRYLKCSSMRYDLALFHGVEIGVLGKQKQDDLLSYLDVEEIIVLGHSR